MNGSGHGFIARDLFLDGLNHATLAAFGIAASDHLLGDNVITTGFDLACFRVAGGVRFGPEHRTTGSKAEGNSGQGKKQGEVFHDRRVWLVR